MTILQAQAVWALYREGLHQVADEAEAQWLHGESFQLGYPSGISKSTEEMIRRSNWEATRPHHDRSD